MTVVNPGTGEIRTTSETWADLRARAERFRLSAPETPPEIDRELRELEALSFEIADLLMKVSNELSDAKQILSAEIAQASLKFEQKGRTQTLVNRLAEAECAVSVAEVAKHQIVLDHARRIGRVLSEKHYGLMNTNRGVQGMVASAHRRTT